MQCEDAILLISARIDGELAAEDRRRLEAHLGECADCGATAEAMQLQDAQLLRGFAPHRKTAAAIADRVSERLSPATRPIWTWWIPVLTSAAAGFLLAALILRPWQKSARPTPPVQTVQALPIGRLDVATGAVELLPPGKDDWEQMVTGGTVVPGSRLRTAPGVRCELAMSDGSEVRINEQSEIWLKGMREIDLARGQVFSLVAKHPQAFQVAAAGSTITALGTRFDVERKLSQVVLAVVEGSARLSGAAGNHVVKQGEVVAISGDRLTPMRGAEALEYATRWNDEILMLKGRDTPELSERVNDIFARIGEEKMAFLRENELRALGDHCVVPLTCYLQSPLSQQHEFKRVEAARIIADVAQPWCIPYLIELLSDGDGSVRLNAARALERLTGQDQGRSPEQWRDQNPGKNQSAIQRWKHWWEQNKARYPGAPAASPAFEPAANNLMKT